MRHVYYGPEYGDSDIRAALGEAGASWHKLDEDQLIARAADQIAEGKIVGWFQGRMEFGPRALGNRSILADPRRHDMKDILNSRIKYREPFRPFCPSILAECAGDYFETDYPSPFMVMAYKIKPSRRDRIPPVTPSAATSQLLTDLARHLAGQGLPVTVICGRSDYADANSGDLFGVSVRRTFNLPFGHGKISRVLSYGSFYVGAAWLGLTTRQPDTVLTLTTPPLLSIVGTLVKKLRGSRHYIWEMDVYPDIAIQLGVLSPRGPLTRIIGALADWSRRNADGIIALASHTP